MDILYHKRAENDDLPVSAKAETHLFCIEISDVKSYAETLVVEITNTSWISELDPVARMSYENTAKKTIEDLVVLFESVQDKVQADFGEFMISLSSGACLKDKHSHVCLPMSELWKEKKSRNHGFDFHTISPNEKISFGESKFQSSGNAYTSAAEQTHRFSREEKDKIDAVHLQHFGSPATIQNLEKWKEGLCCCFLS